MSQVTSRTPHGLASAVRRGWWLFFARGVLALALGVFALVAPGATLAAVLVIVGAYFIVDGLFAVVKAFATMRSDASWWLLFLAGAVSIVVGAVILRRPGVAAVTLAYLVGSWALVTGVLEIVVATALRRAITGAWIYIVFGVISIAFGSTVLLVPALGLAYLAILLGIYGLTGGIALIAVAFRLKRPAL